MSSGITLLEQRRRNSLGEGQEDFDMFTLAGEQVCFRFRYLFDAGTDEWGRGYAHFTRGGFARCLAQFRQQGEAKLEEGQCAVEFRRTRNGVHISVHGFEDGAKCVENIEIAEVPDSVYELLDVVGA